MILTDWLQHWKHPSDEETLRQRIQIDPHWSAALQAYLSHPFPHSDTPLNTLRFLALDFETTGLTPAHDQVLSIGMVDLTLEAIDIASHEELLINHGEFIKPETAQINELTPHALEQGISLVDGMNRLLERAQGKILLAHHCQIEKSFIATFLRHHYQLQSFPAYFVDTLKIEKRFSYAGKSKHHGSYQLNDLRRYYHLPDYCAHSAASDALACGELFLVQAKKLGLQKKPIRQLLTG
ncbi:exonuclease domain-containing protein [Vibrio sp. MEBiC08052]|uniref:exonuclease domain-containing protein n=1 Tax=Vibrio sp. MEBiC08052 TaxID=1761910 RepID=UPI0007406EE6|nr:exonuclease domain-containing protein [Vibrio sp. MEBiC08052]KUI97484.1 DNA polymerase III subunit epsilon [Vibrio sp. MEBiC08052]